MPDEDGVEWLAADVVGRARAGPGEVALATIDPVGSANDETIAAGSRRRPLSPVALKRVRWGVALLLVALLVGAAVQWRRIEERPSTAELAQQQELVNRIDGALAPAALPPVIARGVADSSCRPVSGDSMSARVARAVLPRLPSYAVFDQSEIYEAGSSLCAATVRLHGPAGAVLVVTIETPLNKPAGDVFATRSQSGGQLRALSRTSTDGWRIGVGAVATRENLPSRTQLAAIAADPGLTW
ncbi:hypothetical protein SAMN05444157_0092 [Frankineae bacterium MT45]|nr:hypothetical protein SAMN05444157_0092 [Frankineae bacterium MT45]